MAILTDVAIKTNRIQRLGFLAAFRGAAMAVTQDEGIRSIARAAGDNEGGRQQMLSQFRAFTGWRRKQKARKAKRAASKRTRQVAAVAEILAEKKARAKARKARAKARAAVTAKASGKATAKAPQGLAKSRGKTK